MARVNHLLKGCRKAFAYLLVLGVIGHVKCQAEGDAEIPGPFIPIELDDVSLFVTNKEVYTITGIEDTDGQALESLLSYSLLDEGRVQQLKSGSTQVLITNFTDVQSTACSISILDAPLLQAGFREGRRLLQCLAWFSRCGSASAAAIMIDEPCIPLPDETEDCPPPTLPPSPPPEPPPRPVYVTLCILDECVTFDIPISNLGRDIFSDAQQICSEQFPDVSPIDPEETPSPSPSPSPDGVDEKSQFLANVCRICNKRASRKTGRLCTIKMAGRTRWIRGKRCQNGGWKWSNPRTKDVCGCE